MEVKPPYVKKTYAFGLYAAHMIPMGAFEEWGWLFDWMGRSEKYEFDQARNDPECMNGMLEECLSYVPLMETDGSWSDIQLDLLLPIRSKQKIETEQ